MSKRHRKQPWAKSYRRAQGTITRGQRDALRRLWPHYGITLKYGEVLDLTAACGHAGPHTLEIGFGMGQSLAQLAQRHPDRSFIGIEPHRPGLGALLKRLEADDLHNVRVIRGDVLTLLRDHLDGSCLDHVWILFPDPWPKERDAQRRIVRPLLLDLLEPCLAVGATLHIATDVDGYAEHVDQVMSGRPGWTGGRLSERPDRPMTQYEARGLGLGHEIHDFEWSFRPVTSGVDPG